MGAPHSIGLSRRFTAPLAAVRLGGWLAVTTRGAWIRKSTLPCRMGFAVTTEPRSSVITPGIEVAVRRIVQEHQATVPQTELPLQVSAAGAASGRELADRQAGGVVAEGGEQRLDGNTLAAPRRPEQPDRIVQPLDVHQGRAHAALEVLPLLVVGDDVLDDLTPAAALVLGRRGGRRR